VEWLNTSSMLQNPTASPAARASPRVVVRPGRLAASQAPAGCPPEGGPPLAGERRGGRQRCRCWIAVVGRRTWSCVLPVYLLKLLSTRSRGTCLKQTPTLRTVDGNEPQLRAGWQHAAVPRSAARAQRANHCSREWANQTNTMLQANRQQIGDMLGGALQPDAPPCKLTPAGPQTAVWPGVPTQQHHCTARHVQRPPPQPQLFPLAPADSQSRLGFLDQHSRTAACSCMSRSFSAAPQSTRSSRPAACFMAPAPPTFGSTLPPGWPAPRAPCCCRLHTQCHPSPPRSRDMRGLSSTNAAITTPTGMAENAGCMRWSSHAELVVRNADTLRWEKWPRKEPQL
jgi:hypothetical protein